MFTLKTPAKINWFLSVLGKRADNFHEIFSLMQGVSVFDELMFQHSDGVYVQTEAAIPVSENLVYKAAVLLREKLSVKNGAAITLKKEIPLSAGLGGGSSDAACALTGLNKLWNLGLSIGELLRYAEQVGSDVPFFLNGHFAVVEGRGEKVTLLKTGSSISLLLVKPHISVSTAWAYAKINRGMLNPELTKKDNNIKLFSQALDRRDFEAIASMMKNDLETPVIGEFRIIAELKKTLLETGAKASLMSGSGPTVFGVFENIKEAESAVSRMEKSFPDIWCRAVETII